MSQQTSDRPVLTPGPNHPITIEPNPSRVVVSFAGKVIADTHDALELREADYRPVQYIPMRDVDSSLLLRTEHESYCPFKGDASYFTIAADGQTSENGVWEYLHPYDAVAEIKGRVAFYRDRVDAIEERTEE
jgi:uncharacterized protein (DUF427 family)